MVRRGFTLIEVLAVIAILVVVTAISLPAIEGRLGGARFDAALRRVDAGLAWARAEAQRGGIALRVETQQTPDGAGLFLEPLDTVETSAAQPTKPGAEGSKASPPAEPFAVLDLGLTLSDQPPDVETISGGPVTNLPAAIPMTSSNPLEGASPADAAAPLILATFLPDGSAMASGLVYLVGFDRAASLRVNHWTGGVLITAIDLSAAAGGPSADAPKKSVRGDGAHGSTGAEGKR